MTSDDSRSRLRSFAAPVPDSHDMHGAHSPQVPIPGLPGTTVGDFWSWAYSNLVDNTVRPVFAEFLVGALLGVESAGRASWDAADLRLGDKLIEVKSSAYVQAWKQSGPSKIVFDIERKRAWDAKTNITADIPTRSADCYVFCLYPEKDLAAANPLDVNAWQFWVMSTERINAVFGDQKSVALSRIVAQGPSVSAAELRTAVLSALEPRAQEAT